MNSTYKKKIFITGHRGMVGSAFLRYFKKKKNFHLIFANKDKINLEDQKKVDEFFKKNKPNYVINAAALAGGILANEKFSADFIEKNLIIQHNIIKSSFNHNVQKLLFLGSSCIYPKMCDQPMKEKYLLSNYLEKTNEAYAIAKIAGLKMCEYFNSQYKTDFRVVMPTNIYGTNYKYNDKNSHVIPALIKRFHDAKIKNKKIVKVWGTGNALREFIFVDDVIDISVKVLFASKKSYLKFMKNKKINFLNIGSGQEISIKQLSNIIKIIVGYKGKIIFDKRMKDGTPRKLLDISNMKKFTKKIHFKNLKEGLRHTYTDFLKLHG
jgi:GDP-L-fucose synthase